jgi:hypothetical protein
MDIGRFAGRLLPTAECALDGCDATHQKWLPDAFMADAAHCLLLCASITDCRLQTHTHSTVFMHYLESERCVHSLARSRQCVAKNAQIWIHWHALKTNGAVQIQFQLRSAGAQRDSHELSGRNWDSSTLKLQRAKAEVCLKKKHCYIATYFGI